MTRSIVYGADVDIDMGANPITNVEDPTNDQDAATKNYVDDAVAAGGPTFATPAIVLGTAAAAGSTDEVIRKDSTIVAFDATVPSTQAFGDAAATGSAAVAARRDHKHAMPATPTSVSGNAGTATALQTGRTIDGQTFDGTANITVIAPGTHAATSKTTPVDNDEIPLVDSAASNVLKKLLWSNVKATLKTYFDTLYSAIGAYAPGGTDVAVADGGTGASTAATARSNLGVIDVWDSVTQVSGSTFTTVNTSLTDITGLTFAAAANSLYEVDIVLDIATSADTNGCRYGVGFSAAGATGSFDYHGGAATLASSILNGPGVQSGNILTASGAVGHFRIKGIMRVGANAGNITAQAMKVTSGTATVQIGSVMRVKKLA